MFSLDKYIYETDGKNYVIANQTYCGNPVKGKAICGAEDTFDFEYGKRLAAARCNEKIAEKRFGRASKQYHDLLNFVDEVVAPLISEKRRYYEDSCDALVEAKQELDKTEREGGLFKS